MAEGGHPPSPVPLTLPCESNENNSLGEEKNNLSISDIETKNDSSTNNINSDNVDTYLGSDDEGTSNSSLHIIVRDVTSSLTGAKISMVTPAVSTVGELIAEVGRRFKYQPYTFSLVLIKSGGKQVRID